MPISAWPIASFPIAGGQDSGPATYAAADDNLYQMIQTSAPIGLPEYDWDPRVRRDEYPSRDLVTSYFCPNHQLSPLDRSFW